MHDSQLTTAIAGDTYLAQRIQGVLTKARGVADVTETEAQLLRYLTPDQLAGRVAGNPTIFAQVRAALDAQPEGEVSVTEAIATGLTDSDLEFVILSQVTFLRG